MTGPVLVTGATGGLGRVLVARLRAAGHDVRATGRNAETGATLGVPFIVADLARDPLEPLCRGIGTVFHLAALSAPWGPRTAFHAANVVATQRLLDAAAQAGCGTFIHVSTPSLYARAAHQIGITEATPLPPRLINAYAETKHLAEEIVCAETRMACVALRPRAIISPHDSVLLPRLIRASQTGRMPLPGGGRALMEITDARDVCDALIFAARAGGDVSGRVFNISGGVPRSFRQLAEHAFSRLGRTVSFRSVPVPVAMGAAALLEAFARLRPGQPEPALTRYAVLAAGYSQTFDLTAAREALGWTPHHSPEAAIDWALRHGEVRHA